jgi:hypothetical protein
MRHGGTRVYEGVAGTMGSGVSPDLHGSIEL